MPWDAELARARSRDELARFGIDVPESLPLLFEPEALQRLRRRNDVIARSQALYGVVAISDGGPRDLVFPSLEARDLSRWLSERERRFVEGPSDEDERIQMSWRIEALTALGWALGLVDELSLSGAEAAAGAFEPLDPDGSRGDVDDRVQLRSTTQLADRLDAFYCAHWAAREQQLTSAFDPWPEALVPGAIMERRHGLEWLFADPSYDWEDVDLST